MTRLIERYRIRRGDNLGDPELWNRVFEDIDNRLHARELDGSTIDGAVEALTATALRRLDDTFTPVVQEAISALESVGALFEAESASEETIGLGVRNLVLSAQTRRSFVGTQWVTARPVAAPANGMIARLTSYDRETGLMVLECVTIRGAGTYSAWTIGVTAPPDLDHAGRTDNPHAVTAQQVGTYPTATIDAQLATKATPADITAAVAAETAARTAALNALLGSPPGVLDTLNELATALGDDPNFAATIAAQIAAIKKAEAGDIVAWPLATARPGSLICDGSAVSRTTYAALYARIGTMYGSGNGATTFNLPDLRGEFLRGVASGSSSDPDRSARTNRGDGTAGDNVGTKQPHAIQDHAHSVRAGSGTGGANTRPSYATTFSSSTLISGAAEAMSQGSISTETRPRNVAVTFCIVY